MLDEERYYAIHVLRHHDYSNVVSISISMKRSVTGYLKLIAAIMSC